LVFHPVRGRFEVALSPFATLFDRSSEVFGLLVAQDTREFEQ